MIAVVIRSRRARGLHKELDLVERAGVLTVKLHLIGLLDWVLLHEHVLDQLLDHLGRDGRAERLRVYFRTSGPGFFQFA